MFIHKNMVGDRGLSTVREHTVVSGGVHGPGKGVLKRPGLQKSSTSHRGSLTQTQATPVASDVPSTFSSKPVASEKASLGGKASLQPKRTPMTQEEINAIMSSDVSMKNKGHNKMNYSQPGPGKGILKRSGLQNSSTNHRSQPTHKTDGSLRLRDEDSPVRERAKPFSHNPSFLRSGSKKRKRNGDLEDHLEVNSPLIDTHTNDLEFNSPLTDIHTNDLQSEEHIGSTSNGTTVTRKETRALSAAKRSRLNNSKLVFEVDECAGRIVGDDSQVFITKGGCLVRERAKFWICDLRLGTSGWSVVWFWEWSLVYGWPSCRLCCCGCSSDCSTALLLRFLREHHLELM